MRANLVGTDSRPAPSAVRRALRVLGAAAARLGQAVPSGWLSMLR
jgi:hypothetical protein